MKGAYVRSQRLTFSLRARHRISLDSSTRLREISDTSAAAGAGSERRCAAPWAAWGHRRPSPPFRPDLWPRRAFGRSVETTSAGTGAGAGARSSFFPRLRTCCKLSLITLCTSYSVSLSRWTLPWEDMSS